MAERREDSFCLILIDPACLHSSELFDVSCFKSADIPEASADFEVGGSRPHASRASEFAFAYCTVVTATVE